MNNRRIAFRNARLIDPASGLDAKGGLAGREWQDRRYRPALVRRCRPQRSRKSIDCNGLVLAPGLIDMRVFTGEPGSEHRETLESASRAAAAGGVTTIVVMPNTDPVIDEPSLVDFIRRRAQATAKVRVVPMAALTRHLAGEVMTEIGLAARKPARWRSPTATAPSPMRACCAGRWPMRPHSALWWSAMPKIPT